MALYDINRELKKWDDRVLFQGKFKPNTKANLDRLDTILFGALEHFSIIAANSEPLVYKIGRHFIEKNIKNDDMVFIEGKIVECYLNNEGSANWKKKDRVDDFFEIFGGNFRGKWILIPYMKFEIEIGLALYFISQFRKYSAIGLIFYSEGPSCLTEVLSLDSEDPYFFEYPNKCYRQRKRKIEDDEY